LDLAVLRLFQELDMVLEDGDGRGGGLGIELGLDKEAFPVVGRTGAEGLEAPDQAMRPSTTLSSTPVLRI
jgi:hypothetical protein